jgi:FAD/FMN-containing dehydrogenase
MANIVEELRSLLGDQAVLVGEAVTGRARSWIDSAPLAAKAIIRPRTTEEVAAVLRLCNEHRQPLVTHGGRTNLVGGTDTSAADLVLSLERMDQVEAVNGPDRTMVVQSGAPLQRVQEAAAGSNLLFPLDLAARGTATIGGCAAMNAGGVRVLRYGVMRDLILGLEAVLPDGTIISSMNRMLKNNAGYDLKQLFIGSEGTLGIITRLVLRLFPAPASVNTAMVACRSFGEVSNLLQSVWHDLDGPLVSFEVMWADYYRLTTTPPATARPPISGQFPFYVLVEAQGTDRDVDRTEFEWALDRAHRHGYFVDAVLAANAQQRAQLWKVREDSEQIERQHHLTFGFDVSLPLSTMESYIDAVRAGFAARYGTAARCWVYGHLADGNLHINLWAPQFEAQDRPVVEEIVYRPLRERQGSISAEHGIGLEKKAYLTWTRTDAEVELMRRLKRVLDPQLILNSGRVFDL